MKLGFQHGLNIGQKIKQGQNIELGNILVGDRLDQEEQEEKKASAPEPEAPEPPTTEDLADSDRFSDDAPPGSAFDRGWHGSAPLISQLPRRLRPPVRFLIDADLNLHRLGDEVPKAAELELAVAEAVVAHVRNTGVVLGRTGDWCTIPCIGSDSELLALVPEHLRTVLDEARLHSIGSIVKDFAIQLPSGDVITPQTVLDRARRDKRTTRAAALSLATQHPEVMPDGERWTREDWKGFENTQRKKGYSSASQSRR